MCGANVSRAGHALPEILHRPHLPGTVHRVNAPHRKNAKFERSTKRPPSKRSRASTRSHEEVTHPTFEQADDSVVVYADGDEVEWGDYVDELTADALILGFWNENGWETGSDEVHLVAPGVIVESHVCDDYRAQTLHEDVADAAGLALDLLDDSEKTVALAVSIYGPLFDGNTTLPRPLLPMTPWEASPFAEGNDGEEDPMLHWGFCTGASEEVRAEFRRRVEAGRYPLVTELREVGSPAWRAWVIGLLTAVPLSDQVPADGYPLVSDLDRLADLSTENLLKTATKNLSFL